MNCKKTFAMVVGALVLMTSVSVFAELELKPYGAAQYRFRGQFNSIEPSNGDGFTTFDYNNTMSWRLGTRVGVDEKLSLQFQIGNDWSPGDNVSWTMNNTPRARITNQQNLYVHLASARLNLGYLFLEGGVVPFNSNGTLDLLESSLSNGWYGEAGFNSWTHTNNSILGFRVGAPIVKGDVKVSAELLQSIVRVRQQSLVKDPPGNPPAILMVLNVPVEAGAFKITPEFTTVLNRNYSTAEEAGDHEIIVGAAASYKVNDKVTANLSGGYGMLDNENSKVSAYRLGVQQDLAEGAAPATYNAKGMLLTAGTTIRNVGPGNVIVNVNYNNTVNDHSEATQKTTDQDFIDADFRYVYRIHKNYTITSRYRLYYLGYPESHSTGYDSRMNNRFEFLFEGSF